MARYLITNYSGFSYVDNVRIPANERRASLAAAEHRVENWFRRAGIEPIRMQFFDGTISFVCAEGYPPRHNAHAWRFWITKEDDE